MIKTKHSTWSPQWSDTQHELFRDFGFAAFTAQMLEASIIQILLAANYAGYIRLGNPIDIDSTLARKTLGHLTKLMEERGLIDARLTELLRDALEARNELIHQFFVINGDFLSDEGRVRCSRDSNGSDFGLVELKRYSHRFANVCTNTFLELPGTRRSSFTKIVLPIRRPKIGRGAECLAIFKCLGCCGNRRARSTCSCGMPPLPNIQ